MSLSALSSVSSPAALGPLSGVPLELSAAASRGTNSPADVKRAAGQFEAILVRQLLSPALEPLMSGGLGGSSGAGSSGGGVYGYMLTDVLSNALTQGGGLGLGQMIERQFSPAAPLGDATPTAITSSRALSSPAS